MFIFNIYNFFFSFFPGTPFDILNGEIRGVGKSEEVGRRSFGREHGTTKDLKRRERSRVSTSSRVGVRYLKRRTTSPYGLWIFPNRERRVVRVSRGISIFVRRCPEKGNVGITGNYVKGVIWGLTIPVYIGYR